MIFLTSISPKHINAYSQKLAVDTWLKFGKVVSFNTHSEVIELENKYPDVAFVSTVRTLEKTYSRPLVSINAMLDWAKESKEVNFCIINSDIELKCDFFDRIETKMQDSILLCHRVNHNGDYNGAQYLRGIDVFFLHKKFLPFFPQSMHALGMTFWDYFIPYIAVKAGIETYFIKQDIAYHLDHAAQYSEDNWRKSGRYFLWENELYQFSDTHGIGRMSDFVYRFIHNTTKKIEI